MKRLTLMAALLLMACGDTTQEQVAVPLSVQGQTPSATVRAQGDISVTLTEATLVVGPLYLCAAAQAGDLCEAARLEWIDAVAVNALAPGDVRAGTLVGADGVVRSWMLDLGRPAVLTQDTALHTEATRALGGASVRITGTAKVRGATMAFAASVEMAQPRGAVQTVPLLRRGLTAGFPHTVTADDPGVRITVDATGWLVGVDFTAFFDAAGCTENATCTTPIEFDDTTLAYRNIRTAVLTSGGIHVTWRQP